MIGKLIEQNTVKSSPISIYGGLHYQQALLLVSSPKFERIPTVKTVSSKFFYYLIYYKRNLKYDI
jgi:hypothetical protein